MSQVDDAHKTFDLRIDVNVENCDYFKYDFEYRKCNYDGIIRSLKNVESLN